MSEQTKTAPAGPLWPHRGWQDATGGCVGKRYGGQK